MLRSWRREPGLIAILAKQAEFDAPVAGLQAASEDQFGADRDAVLWGRAAWLTDVTANPKNMASERRTCRAPTP